MNKNILYALIIIIEMFYIFYINPKYIDINTYGIISYISIAIFIKLVDIFGIDIRNDMFFWFIMISTFMHCYPGIKYFMDDKFDDKLVFIQSILLILPFEISLYMIIFIRTKYVCEKNHLVEYVGYNSDDEIPRLCTINGKLIMRYDILK